MGRWLLDLGATVWGFVLFLPVFCLLLFLGVAKGLLVGPLAFGVIFVGNVAVVLGLWPALVFWTYECIFKTKMLGVSLKMVAVLCAPLVLVLWPATVILGSLLVGLGYGFFTPLVATFEAAGKEGPNKSTKCITDGTLSIVQGSCTVVRDFTDWCYHSCPAYLSDFRQQEPDGGPYSISLLEIPSCFVAAVLGAIVEIAAFALIALVKSPFMLIKGWQRLLEDLIVSRDGACVKVVCFPFAGLAIVLWPLVVVAAVLAAIFSSFFVGLYSAVVVHQENSFKNGLAYIVSMVAEFDEYTNDVLYLREGSCLPRPKYSSRSETTAPVSSARNSFHMKQDKHIPEQKSVQLTSSKSLRQTIQEVKMFQIWDHMFKTCEQNTQELLQQGIVTAADLDEWIRSSDRNKNRLVSIGIPAHTLLKNLLVSAKCNSAGLMLHNGMELTSFNRPQDRILDWFFEPLLVLKEQIRAARLSPSEELFLEKITLLPPGSDWENGSTIPEDKVRRGELEALSRRIQGIATSTSRFPTFRRRYEKFIKLLTQPRSSSKRTERSSSMRTELRSSSIGTDELV